MTLGPFSVIHVVSAAPLATVKPAATPDHDDATPLRVFSVLALSLMERTPESIGEETVQSIRVGAESMATLVAESCAGGTVSVTTLTAESCAGGSVSVTADVADSGMKVCTISVTGRTLGICAFILTVSVAAGLTKPLVGTSSESQWGAGLNEVETLTGLGEGLSLTQGESKSGRHESARGVMGECLVEGADVDSSTSSNCMGMSEFVLAEGGSSADVSQCVIGTGEGLKDEGRLLCVDGVTESANMV